MKITDTAPVTDVLHDDAPSARLVAAAGSTPEAWAALGLGRVSVSVGAHARALVEGLDPATAWAIVTSVRRGRQMIDAHEGPVPRAWVARMKELHREALLGLWKADGKPTKARVFQVVGAMPVRWGDWLDTAIARVDDAGDAFGGAVLEAAALALVDRAVEAWLSGNRTGERHDG